LKVIRQVAGYARLNKVRKELNILDDRMVECLIIYPDISGWSLDNTHQGELVTELSLAAIKRTFADSRHQLNAYRKIYKIGVRLPIV